MVRAGGQAATGRIEVKVGSKTYKARLEGGRATVELKPFGSTGKKKVKVTYLGNASTEAAIRDGDHQRPSPLRLHAGLGRTAEPRATFHPSKRSEKLSCPHVPPAVLS